jgi:hypothetical protein
MKLKLSTRTAVTALFVALSPLAVTGFASAQTAKAYRTQESLLKTTDEALDAMTKVHSARLALFDNDIALATQSVKDAKSAVTNSESDLSSLLMRDFTNVDTENNYLPFDMSMSLTEGYKATEENKLALQRAYGLFESASPDDAVEVLRLANIDVQVSAAMLPFEDTLTRLDDALGNIEDGAYFDANLDLKAIADSVIINAFSIDAVPEQGNIM